MVTTFFKGGKGKARMNHDCSNDFASITVHNRRLTDRSHVTSPLFYVPLLSFS